MGYRMRQMNKRIKPKINKVKREPHLEAETEWEQRERKECLALCTDLTAQLSLQEEPYWAV